MGPTAEEAVPELVRSLKKIKAGNIPSRQVAGILRHEIVASLLSIGGTNPGIDSSFGSSFEPGDGVVRK